jgi:Flp pilus assembly protein CpaB
MGVQPKKSSRLFILLGVVLTLLSMVGVYFVARSSSKSAAGTTQVLVATRVIPIHTTFTTPADVATWFVQASVSSTATPQGAFTSVADFVKAQMVGGKVSNTETIYPKEVVLPSMFTGIGSRPTWDVTAQLAKGDVAVSIQSSTVDESAGAIQSGDYVDLIASYLPAGGGSGATETGQQGSGQTQYVLQDLKVLAVGTLLPSGASSPAGSSTMLTFAVNHETALIIQHLKDFGGSWLLSVVLRSAYSNTTYGTHPINGTYYFTHLRNNFWR